MMSPALRTATATCSQAVLNPLKQALILQAQRRRALRRQRKGNARLRTSRLCTRLSALDGSRATRARRTIVKTRRGTRETIAFRTAPMCTPWTKTTSALSRYFRTERVKERASLPRSSHLRLEARHPSHRRRQPCEVLRKGPFQKCSQCALTS